jgi:hypothetical protein
VGGRGGVTRSVRDPVGRFMLMSSRTTTGSTSLSRVKAWERCSVCIAAVMVDGESRNKSNEKFQLGFLGFEFGDVTIFCRGICLDRPCETFKV